MKTNIEELKRMAEAATPGPWRAAISSSMVNSVCTTFETVCETGKNIDDALYIAAANPAAVLELIDYIDYLRGKNREHFDACIGCDEELKRVTKQRNELLAALKEAAMSLETIHLRSYGEESHLHTTEGMRAYAGSRASVAFCVLAKAEG